MRKGGVVAALEELKSRAPTQDLQLAIQVVIDAITQQREKKKDNLFRCGRARRRHPGGVAQGHPGGAP
jgi:hypothetical protein